MSETLITEMMLHQAICFGEGYKHLKEPLIKEILEKQKIFERLELAVKQEDESLKKLQKTRPVTFGDASRYWRIKTILTGKVWGEPAECFKELEDKKVDEITQTTNR